MTDEEQDLPLCRGLRYHDYLVLVAKIDAEWTRNRPTSSPPCLVSSAFYESQNHFANTCYKYADGLEQSHKDFIAANKYLKESPSLDHWLYQPMFYIPLGHADTLAICLFDDFDPPQSLAREIPTTVEDISLGFCPKVECYSAADNDILCDLHKLFRVESRPKHDPGLAKKNLRPPSHPFQESMPLLVFTQFKIHALGTIGEAVLFQGALIRAMGKKIVEYTQQLRVGHSSDLAIRSLIEDIDDLNYVKVSLLDLQGSEEIGMLVFTRNYSVATAYVTALRSLTYADVFEADSMGVLEVFFKNSESHNSIIGIGLDFAGKETTPDYIKCIRNNPAFRWSHSSLSVTSPALFDRKTQNCHGYAEAYIEYQIPPGSTKTVNELLVVSPAKSFSSISRSDKYLTVQMGTGDLLVKCRSSDYEEKSPFIQVAGILDIILKNLTAFGVASVSDQGRRITNMATQLYLPIPKFENNLHVDACTPVLVEALKEIQCRMFSGQSRSGNKLLDQYSGQMDIKILCSELKKYGVPVALRRSIESLYQYYAILIRDPFLFDSVIDLYDSLATLYSILTEHLPNQRAEELGRDANSSLGMLDGGSIRQIADFVEAIYNALDHRLSKNYLEERVRDMSIDFRGGLNQIVSATDATLKCGLGLVRRYVMNKPDELNRAGALTKINFTPGATCYHLLLGTEKNAHLAYMEVDIHRILNVTSYIDYLHEAFHVVVDAFISESKPKSGAAKDSIEANVYEVLSDKDLVISERLREIFAHLMSRLFVYGGADRAANQNFALNTLANYATNFTDVGTDNFCAIIEDGEMLLRLFYAYDAVADIKNAQVDEAEKKIWGSMDRSRQATRCRFVEFIKITMPVLWLPNEKQSIAQEELEEYFFTLFDETYSETGFYMPWIYEKAVSVYKQHFQNSGVREYVVEVMEQIQSSLEKGWSLSSVMPGGGDKSRPIEDQNGIGSFQTQIDPLFMICWMFEAYHKEILGAIGKQFHLKRDPKTANPVYSSSDSSKEWFGFQLDKGANSWFCPVPSLRRKRLTKQIVMIKTFWNISAVLKARRITHIIKNNWEKSDFDRYIKHCQTSAG